jgi:hypothetical protein
MFTNKVLEDELGHSFVNKIDYAKWPLLKKARMYEFTIRKDEALFIPAGWWYFDTGLSELNAFVKVVYNNITVSDKVPCFVSFTDLEVSVSTEYSVTVSKVKNTFGTKSTKWSLPEFYLYEKPLSTEEFSSLKNPYHCVMDNPCEVKKGSPVHPDFVPVLSSSVFVKHKDSTSFLKRQDKDACLCQVQGATKVFLFSPFDEEFLYLLNPCKRDVIDIIIKNDTPLKHFVKIFLTPLKDLELGNIDRLPIAQDIFSPAKTKRLNTLYSELLFHFSKCQELYNKDTSKEGAGPLNMKVENFRIGEIKPCSFFLALESGSIRVRNYDYEFGPMCIVIFPPEPHFFNLTIIKLFRAIMVT